MFTPLAALDSAVEPTMSDLPSSERSMLRPNVALLRVLDALT